MEHAAALKEKHIEKLIEETVGPHSKLNPARHSILHKVIEYIEYTEKGFSVAELIPVFERLIEGRAFLSFASSGATLLSIALFPVNAMLEIMDAYESGVRMYSMRAVAYTITAWAFNKPTPMESRQYLSNLSHGYPRVLPKDMDEYKKAWKKSSMDTLNKIKSGLLLKSTNEKDAKVIFRALGDGQPGRLCSLLMKGMEEHFESIIVKRVWISNYRFTYPF